MGILYTESTRSDQDFEYLAGLYFSYVFYTNNYTLPTLYNESARSDQDLKVLADFILFLFLTS
jgi:hypothetical protein